LTAVQGVDLNVAEGEIVGFLGPNGAGKAATMGLPAVFMAHNLIRSPLAKGDPELTSKTPPSQAAHLRARPDCLGPRSGGRVVTLWTRR